MKIKETGVLPDDQIAYLFEQARLKAEEERRKKIGFFGKSPEEIEKVVNYKERQMERHNFKILNELYTWPLLEKARRISEKKKLTFKNPEKLSIYARCNALYHYIKRAGKEKGIQITNQQLEELIPTSKEDREILLKARSIGFNLSLVDQESLMNYDRVHRARERLIKKKIIEDDHIKEYEEFINEKNGKKR